MSWLVSAKQYIPAVIGEPFGGGFFAGYISHTADGNPTHALIVAPRATGATGSSYTLTTNLAYAANANAPDGVNYSSTLLGGTVTGSITGTTMTVTAVSSGKVRPGCTITGTTVALGTIVISQISGTTNGVGDYTVSISQTVTSRTLTAATSEFDGAANGTLFRDIDPAVGTGSGVTTVFPAANFSESLSIGGHTDWYLPSRYENDIAFFNLKPTSGANSTNRGVNIYAVPQRNVNYSPTYPFQTTIDVFAGGSEAFSTGAHNSSNEFTATNAWQIDFVASNQSPFLSGDRKEALLVRAFRRIAL